MRTIVLTSILLLTAFPALANGLPDADRDGVPDQDETGVYYIDPGNPDTDGDGFSDWEELNKGFSPHNPEPLKLEKNDADNDGLNDRLEIKYRTNLINADTDGDGIKDGDEIAKNYDPLTPDGAKTAKIIKIELAKQELSYYAGKVRLDTFKISSGKPGMATPKGSFKIGNKSPKAWSKPYGLWMPYWMGMAGQRFGLHELPVWPNGYREGADHLGKAVSHGCVRMGIGPAKTLYDWADIGTEVVIN